MSNIIAIVGRPNVGKSTLYNRLIGLREAIVDDVSGVTRDRMYGWTDWNGKNFTVIDTGGFVANSNDVFEKAVRSQVRIAMDEAAAIIFMVDVTTGITDLDEQVTEMLRRSKKPIFLAVNKVDNSRRHLEANEFWALGFKNTFFLSAISGSGTGDLLDAVAETVEDEVDTDADLPKFAVIGQPNAGKSSLVNALVGEERNIVTDIAGTTRDSIHTKYNQYGKEFLLIDTAGIRKKHKVEENLEFYSVMRAIRAIDDADVCLIVLDALDGIESQDMNIFSLAVRRNKGIVILVNKWDLMDKETNTARDYEKELRFKIAPFTDVPIVFISALEKQRIFKAVDIAMEVQANRIKKITTSKLNEWLEQAMTLKEPPSHRGKYIKIKYVTQLKTYYPAFAFFCNHPQHVKQDYKNFLANQLRKTFDFTGVPIRLYFRQK
ncbi:MAG: GTP-binding protein [Cognaticolwellia sp.]|jgi:GTP-binding protein